MKSRLTVLSIAAITLLLSTSVAFATSSGQWTLYASGKTSHNSGTFSFPSNSFVNYLTESQKGPLTTSQTITATFTLAGAGNFVGNPNGGCPGSSSSLCPGAVRLFFQSNSASSGSSCAGAGYNEYNYWWSNDGTTNTYYQLTTGATGTTLTVQLSPSNWSDLCGTVGSSSYAATNGFLTALQNVKSVGFSFGSGYFFANGVGASTPETFSVTSFTISP